MRDNQSPARPGSYFTNPQQPVPVILKTASDPCSDSSAIYIPYLLSTFQTRTRRKIRPIRWNATELNYLVLAWCFRSSVPIIHCGRFQLTPPLLNNIQHWRSLALGLKISDIFQISTHRPALMAGQPLASSTYRAARLCMPHAGPPALYSLPPPC